MVVAPPLTTNGSLTTALASTRAFGKRCSNFPPRGLFLKSVAENAFQKWGQTALSCQVDGMGAVWEEIQWLVLNFGPLLPWKRKLGQREGVAYPKQITASMVIQPSSQAVFPVLKFEGWGWASQRATGLPFTWWKKKKIKVLLSSYVCQGLFQALGIEVWTRYSFCPPEAHKLAGEDREVHM